MRQDTTIYDIIKKLDYAHSTAYNTVQEYLRNGIIENVKSEPLPSGLTKKSYRLSEIGSSLLYVMEKIGHNRQHG
jgi:DNA-binding PadR family transcriptional regulator